MSLCSPKQMPSACPQSIPLSEIRHVSLRVLWQLTPTIRRTSRGQSPSPTPERQRHGATSDSPLLKLIVVQEPQWIN